MTLNSFTFNLGYFNISIDIARIIKTKNPSNKNKCSICQAEALKDKALLDYYYMNPNLLK